MAKAAAFFINRCNIREMKVEIILEIISQNVKWMCFISCDLRNNGYILRKDVCLKH